MKPSELELVKRKFPLSASVIRLNQDCAQGLCSQEPERLEGKTLEHTTKREAEGLSFSSSGTIRGRFSIRFEIWAVRPCDWDNYATGTKFVQDLLVEAGILPGDSYELLEGRILSFKAKSKAEERTEILIEPL